MFSLPGSSTTWRLTVFLLPSARNWALNLRGTGRGVSTKCSSGGAHEHQTVDSFSTDVIDFNNDYILARRYSVSYQRQLISALKLYQSFHRMPRLEADHLRRPDVEKQLPMVLSKGEVREILHEIRNLKHRAILSIIYACGLRVSEAVNLKVQDNNQATFQLEYWRVNVQGDAPGETVSRLGFVPGKLLAN